MRRTAQDILDECGFLIFATDKKQLCGQVLTQTDPCCKRIEVGTQVSVIEEVSEEVALNWAIRWWGHTCGWWGNPRIRHFYKVIAE